MESLNIEFSEDKFRILKLNSLKEIVLKEEIELGFNINDIKYIKKNKKEAVNIISEKFSEIQINTDNNIQNACILLNTSQVFLNVFPVDFNEEKNSVDSHILWELSNYFPDSYKDYIVKYYKLNNKFLNENTDEVLLIAVDKNRIDVMKTLCNGSGLKIVNIDIDQFAVEKCLKENYAGNFSDSNNLIIGCKESRFDFSLISEGRLKYYDFQISGKEKFKSLIEKQIIILSSMFEDFKIENVFIYGTEKTLQIKNFFEEEFKNFSVSMIYPLKSKGDQDEESKYAPLYGLALKNFS